MSKNDRLRNERVSKGMSRKDVAAALGLCVSSVTQYENGDRIPRDEMKVKIAKLYDSTVGFLFFNEECH